MPVVVMANLTNIAKTVGVNRIVPTVSVPYPLGNPQLLPEDEWKMRQHRVGVALDSLEKEISEQTIFPVKL